MNPTDHILSIFEQIAAVPRASGHEEHIRSMLQDWANSHGFSSATDAAGNLVLRVPATRGFETAPVVVLQGHMDMVCEKTPESSHDFAKDPIRCIVQGQWLHADGTSLGADNGIAIAVALALAESRTASHPPLELLFTVQEEVGIMGAAHIEPSLVAGKILINLDSEEWGELIVGCAGGDTAHIDLPVSRLSVASEHTFLSLRVDGLQGGHSGAEIHKHRGNANKVLARALDHIHQEVPIQLASLKGGSAHNAIPRSAEAVFACPISAVETCHQRLDEFAAQIRGEYATSDQTLKLLLAGVDAPRPGGVVPPEATERILEVLLALPDGVAHMSARIPGFVETSNNVAVIDLAEDHLQIMSSQRSTVMSRLEELSRRIDSIASLAGAQVWHDGVYPAWQPDLDSPLLQRSVDVYEALFHDKPQVKMIHAGLECGVIGQRCGGMDMISMGPTVHNAHTPREMLDIPSVTRLWSFLTELLVRLAD